MKKITMLGVLLVLIVPALDGREGRSPMSDPQMTKEERAKLVFGVKIKARNPDGALKPGLPADARIDVSEKK